MSEGCLVPYYGSKRQMAATIISHLGEHHAYWDVFCGSCAVPLNKPESRVTVVNDLNGALVNLARVVADDVLGPVLFDRLQRTAFCERLHASSVAWLETFPAHDSPSLDWAYHYFVMAWQGRNGFIGAVGESKMGFCRRFTSSGGDPAVRFRRSVELIPTWWEKMRRWTILQTDALDLLDRIEDAHGVVIYADPPYLTKQCHYLYDLDQAQHQTLADKLKRFQKTRVVLSYYDHPELVRLYPDWVIHPVDVRKNLSVASGNGRAPEVLLVNQ